MKFVLKAEFYSKLNLSTIGVDNQKRAVLPWAKFQKVKPTLSENQEMASKAYGIAIICGAVSGNLEVLDIDSKHDTTGELKPGIQADIKAQFPDIDFPMIQSQSGGLHYYYRCSEIQGNQKLANKPAPEPGKPQKVEVLVETRGEGGYVAAPPTPKYKLLSGSIERIPTITPEERAILLNIGRSYDETPPEPAPIPKQYQKNKAYGFSPFEDFDKRGSIPDLLTANGWSYVYSKGPREYYLRPGGSSSSAKYSGNYHTGLNTFRSFSSSTKFDTAKAYGPAGVFAVLNCQGDKKEAYHKLRALGYGSPALPQGNTSYSSLSKVKVEVETTTEGKTLIASPKNPLELKSIPRDTEKAFIYFTPEATQPEVLNTIAILQEVLPEGSIYVIEREYLSGKNQREEVSYHYQLEEIIGRFAENYEDGDISPEALDILLKEVVRVGTSLTEPIHRGLYKSTFLKWCKEVELGITEASIEYTLNQLQTEKQEKQAAQELNQLLIEMDSKVKQSPLSALEEFKGKVDEIHANLSIQGPGSALEPASFDNSVEAFLNQPPGLSTGYTIGGEPLSLPYGGLSFIVGPTAHGKTTFLINLLINAAKIHPEKHFYFLSYEESKEAIFIKTLTAYLSEKSNILCPPGYSFNTELKKLLEGEVSQFFDVDKITQKVNEFRSLIEAGRIQIFYASGISSEALENQLKKFATHTKAGGFFIDYMQMLNSGGRKYPSRQEELKQICLSLKDTIVNINLPCVLGAQFNRDVVNPSLLHLTKIGEAGDIERIAAFALGIWNTNFPPKGLKADGMKSYNENFGSSNKLYVEVLKDRAGVPGRASLLGFNGMTKAVYQ